MPGADPDPKIAGLRELVPLPGMSDAELGRVVDLLDDLAVPGGTVLMREGRPGQDCFVIADGEAAVVVEGRAITTLGPGAFIGEMALLSGKPRSATVTAMTPMRLLTIPVNAFVALLADSEVARFLLDTMAARLQVNAALTASESPGATEPRG
ncbi:MAG: hypothetical protein NVSMB12_21550 [Acidimicrobiales bacterium]